MASFLQEIMYLVFVVLAAICNAVMDTCSHNYAESIFTRFNDDQFWDASISWKNKYVNWDGGNRNRVKILSFNIWRFHFKGFNKPVSFTDAWHLFKRIMLICLAGAIVTYRGHELMQMVVDTILTLVAWNVTFHLFYHKLLKQ